MLQAARYADAVVCGTGPELQALASAPSKITAPVRPANRQDRTRWNRQDRTRCPLRLPTQRGYARFRVPRRRIRHEGYPGPDAADGPALGAAGVFWTYAAICLAGLLFLYIRLPETRDRTLEEIETYVRSGKK